MELPFYNKPFFLIFIDKVLNKLFLIQIPWFWMHQIEGKLDN